MGTDNIEYISNCKNIKMMKILRISFKNDR